MADNTSTFFENHQPLELVEAQTGLNPVTYMTEVETENDITEDMNNTGVTYSNNTNEVVYNLFSNTDFDELTIVSALDKLNQTSDNPAIISFWS